MVRILADQRAQRARVLELGSVGLELELHGRPSLGSLHRFDAVFALARGDPTHALRRGRVSAAREDRHLVRDDERGVKADAELSDQLRVLALIAAQPLEELARARARDGAEVFDHLVSAHPDPVVADGQEALVRI